MAAGEAAGDGDRVTRGGASRVRRSRAGVPTPDHRRGTSEPRPTRLPARIRRSCAGSPSTAWRPSASGLHAGAHGRARDPRGPVDPRPRPRRPRDGRVHVVGARAPRASTRPTTRRCTPGRSRTSRGSGRRWRSSSTSGSTTRRPRCWARATMPGAEWFPGATLNYAEHALAAARAAPTTTSQSSSPARTGSSATVTHAELRDLVGRARAGLVALGVGRGDRVVALAPNCVETLVTFLAAASLGAIWSSCSPDFGARAVHDRFAQIEPAVLLAVDGYVYGGKRYDIRADGRRAARPAAHPARHRPRALPGRAATLDGALPWARVHRRRRRRWSSSRCRSTTRCGCSTPPAPPGCPRASCTATAGSCWSTSRRCGCRWTSGRASGSSGSPPPAG